MRAGAWCSDQQLPGSFHHAPCASVGLTPPQCSGVDLGPWHGFGAAAAAAAGPLYWHTWYGPSLPAHTHIVSTLHGNVMLAHTSIVSTLYDTILLACTCVVSMLDHNLLLAHTCIVSALCNACCVPCSLM